MIGKNPEYVFSYNKFNKPMTIEDNIDIMNPGNSVYKATFIKLLRLIWLEPGTYQNHPKMGVGIVSQFKYSKLDDIMATLSETIRSQVMEYFPECGFPDIELQATVSGGLIITIKTNGLEYKFQTDSKGYFKEGLD